MEVIYGLIPTMIVIGITLVALLFWAIKSGQFDDMEGDAQRILMDEDLSPEKQKESKNEATKTDAGKTEEDHKSS